MEFSHCCNAYFRWCIEMHQRKVQGFGTKRSQTLALDQSQMALKTLVFKAFGFGQYVLYIGLLGPEGREREKEERDPQ